jgi:hypothetical protein
VAPGTAVEAYGPVRPMRIGQDRGHQLVIEEDFRLE